MKDKTSAKEFKNFCSDFLKNSCEEKTIKLTALTGYNLSGVTKLKGEDYYSKTINCVAFIDDKNQVVNNKISFIYYMNNKKPLKVIKTQNVCTYKIKCKKVKDKDFYYLLKIKKAKDKRFDSLIEELNKPITMAVDGVMFVYDKVLERYDAKYNVSDKKVYISLEPENEIDASKSINTFKKINADIISFYIDIAHKCSKEVANLANEWENNCQKITESKVVDRITKGSIAIDIAGDDISVYFDDDDMFLGHTIIYYGNINNDKFNIDIAG